MGRSDGLFAFNHPVVGRLNGQDGCGACFPVYHWRVRKRLKLFGGSSKTFSYLADFDMLQLQAEAPRQFAFPPRQEIIKPL